jgi:hypothetical protein
MTYAEAHAAALAHDDAGVEERRRVGMWEARVRWPAPRSTPLSSASGRLGASWRRERMMRVLPPSDPEDEPQFDDSCEDFLRAIRRADKRMLALAGDLR